MIPFFRKSSDIRFVRHLNQFGDRFALVATPDFISSLYYATRDDPDPEELTIPVHVFSVERMIALNKAAAEGRERRIMLVADGADESARVAQLARDYPQLRVAGLGETFLPMLLARKVKSFDDIPGLDLHRKLDIVLLFAPPRSGSSLVADVLIDMGVGNTGEHLRGTLAGVLAGKYRFDALRATRLFLQMSQENGWVGTKLICHFLQDYLGPGFNSRVLRGLMADGHRIHPIFLERRDTVRQSISGYLASRRGLWHVVDDKSDARLHDSNEVSYNFDAILSRYLSYKGQDAFLRMIAGQFEAPLWLSYEEDCADIAGLSAKLGAYLGRTATGSLDKSMQRKKISSDVNDEYAARFHSDFTNLFGKAPF